MAYPVIRETKMYKKGTINPWVISLLQGAEGKQYISLRPSKSENDIVILEQLEKDDYENVVEIMKTAVNPVVIKER